MNIQCPTDQELEGFLDRRSANPEYTDAASSLLSHHLEICPRCRRRSENLEQDHALLAALADAHVTASAPRPRERSKTTSPLATDATPGYEILSEIHRGGQGVVYRAVQKATKRTVALKVLLQGSFASVRQRQRFEREVDLAAGLRHPNIVTLYDSGVAPDGNLFFAMEHIEGMALDRYIRDRREGLRGDDPHVLKETLGLFSKLCDAVHHAHQHGIIHRDLKPSNILVDAEGEPHVLDFGLAKITDPEQIAKASLMTLTGEFMGTLAYAAPEQTRGDPTLIDVRTDVYALGVLFYEMLTGHLPYRVAGAMADVLSAIAEAEPEPPGAWYRGNAVTATVAAFAPIKLDHEVETIVLKTLSKDPARRYQSAEALRVDIEHYLAGEPIDAKRDSFWYVAGKKLKRRARLWTAVGLIVVLGTVAIINYFQIGEFSDRAERGEARAEHLDATLARVEFLNFTSGVAAQYQPAPREVSRIKLDATVAINADGVPRYLNPLYMYRGELFVCELLFERLFRRTSKLELIPNDHLVAELREPDDPLVKIIKLRPNLRWHDGKPLTSADIVFSWQQTIGEAGASGRRRQAQALREVVAIDPLTVRFVQKEPRATWRFSLNFELVPKHLFEVKMEEDPTLRRDDYYKQLHRHPVGSGPFKFVSWDEKQIILERWDDYSHEADKPKIKRLVIRWIEKPEDKLHAFLEGRLDLCKLTEAQYQSELFTDSFRSVGREAMRPSMRYTYILWNIAREDSPFADARVRKAMTYAINIRQIKAEVTNNLAAACYGPWPVESRFFNPEFRRLAYDPYRADELLNDAGWRLAEDGWRYRLEPGEVPDENAEPFRFSLLVHAGDPSLMRTAELGRKHLARIGVDMIIDSVNKDEFVDRKKDRDFDGRLAGITPSFDPDRDRVMFAGGATRNYGGYANAEVDRLFDKGARLMNPGKRAKCYQEIHRLIYEDQPMTFLYHAPSLYAVSHRLEGIQFSARMGPYLFYPGVRTWWVPR